MKLVDINVLLAAVNPQLADHQVAKSWLDRALSGGAPVGFTWLVLIGFVRIATHPSIFERPMSTAQAIDIVDGWLAAPSARLVHPRSSHLDNLRRLLEATAGGNMTNDAHLAALARDHKGTVVTFDSDFARFPGVRWERPS